MKRLGVQMKIYLPLFLLVILFSFDRGFSTMVDLKNIISIDGLQDNPILGYGIVVGLKGTGDSENGSQTKEIIARIANNFGFKFNSDRLKPKNSAVVVVSAMINPFSQPGSRVDVKVSSVFDAKTLEGGELIITPLIAGDNQIYAAAQGSVITEKSGKGVIGSIPQGAIIQKSVGTSMVNTNGEIAVTVQETLGYNAIAKVVEVLRQSYPDAVKKIQNNKITLRLPENMEIHQFIVEIYKIKADVEEEPSVLIDSKSGIVISGGNVLISEAALSFNGTKLNIGNGSQSGWGGTVAKGDEAVKLYKTSTTVQELVDGLNQMGASGGEISKILQLLYRNGNLKSKLIVQ
jgi:flagellar P-ring protein FlgI